MSNSFEIRLQQNIHIVTFCLGLLAMNINIQLKIKAHFPLKTLFEQGSG